MNSDGEAREEDHASPCTSLGEASLLSLVKGHFSTSNAHFQYFSGVKEQQVF